MTATKDILVHVEESPAGEARLRFAIALAHRFDARLVGVIVQLMPDLVALADSGAAAAALAAYAAELEAQAEDLGERFMATLRRRGLQGALHIARELGTPELAQWACATDLVILNERDPDRPQAPAPEDMILSCGRPVLVVPSGVRDYDIGKNVLVAWNGSREATRAANEAFRLMTDSSIATIFSAKTGAEGRASCAVDLAEHFARHGVKARVESLDAQDSGVADAIQLRSVQLGADLIVMGAFGRSRLRETILGGVTRAMLRAVTVPLLMAH